MTTHFVGDTAVLTGRSLRHVLRSPDTIVTTAVMPIAFMLMFVYIFGGAIDIGEGAYVDYLLRRTSRSRPSSTASASCSRANR